MTVVSFHTSLSDGRETYRDRPPLIRPGEYDVVYEKHELRVLHLRAPKLIVWLRIVTQGKYHDVLVGRYYHMTQINRSKGTFRAGFHSDFINEYSTLFEVPHRLDRVPMTRFHNVIIRARINTVTRNRRGRTRPDGLHYSVIQELIRVVGP